MDKKHRGSAGPYEEYGRRWSRKVASKFRNDFTHRAGFGPRGSGYHGRVLKDQYQYLFFDGVVLKSTGALKVQNKILLCAFGITVEGRHEIVVDADCPRGVVSS